MPIVHRSFTYRDKIKLTSRDLDLALSGRKTCTIRLGKLSVAKKRLVLTDDTRTVPVEILRVDSDQTYENLTDQDAMMDGLDSRAQLDADLRRFYGTVDPKQPMTLIHFRLLEENLVR